jgi:RNA polymerase sigma-70 factor (sigma-E family)
MSVEPQALVKTPEERQSALAFVDVFQAHQAAALRLAYLLTGDAGLAEDVVADAFARMYGRWRRDRIHDPRAYLRRAIVNQVRGRFRRTATRRKHDVSTRWSESTSDAADEGIADRDRLRRALSVLPPRQRATVVLRMLEDLSEFDTAALLGVSTGTVKSHLSRGIERLRAALDEEGGP